ncbi:unnamed protein product [Rhizophagus irregularis]|nr:unnamed protein product [Rhizophagus irregularis]
MLNNSVKINENFNLNNPVSMLDDDNLENLSPTLIYDPNIDYERLVCDLIYKELKGDPFIEKMMNIIIRQEDYEEDYEENSEEDSEEDSKEDYKEIMINCN